MPRQLQVCCTAVAGATALAAAAFAQGDSVAPSPAFSAEDLTAPPRSDWVTNGGTVFNQRYSPLTGLDRDNVSDLKGRWRTSLEDSGIGPELSGRRTREHARVRRALRSRAALRRSELYSR